MECSSVIVDDYDGPSCFTSTFPIASKTHKCCECRSEIKSGEKYNRESGIWDGSPDRYKTCIDCISIRDSFFKKGYVYEQMFEYLKEHIRESYGDISSDCIVDLTDKSRDIVCDMIQDYWSLVER